MKKIYLVIKDGFVIPHSDLKAMKDIEKVDKPDMTITEKEFYDAHCLVRLIDGKIFLGKTEQEITREKNNKRIQQLKALLSQTDYITAKIAEGSATPEEYEEKINERKAWRKEISELE